MLRPSMRESAWIPSGNLLGVVGCDTGHYDRSSRVMKHARSKDSYITPPGRLNIVEAEEYRRLLEMAFPEFIENGALPKPSILFYRANIVTERERRSRSGKLFRERHPRDANKQSHAWKRRQPPGSNYRIKANIRRRIRELVKTGTDNKRRSAELTGCDINALREHLSKQFRPGMSWKNYGPRGWHIDHIKPCARFDLSDANQIRECFHYTNLQPLWWKENISKGDRAVFGLAE